MELSLEGKTILCESLNDNIYTIYLKDKKQNKAKT